MNHEPLSMELLMRTKTSLQALAARYASERRVPAATITKEILHYEILFAMLECGSLQNLAFQGGTALRLCHGGSRYSEDLDFAGGKDFSPVVMEKFEDYLMRSIADAYGLSVETVRRRGGGDGVSVDTWKMKVSLPQADRSLPQKQVINIEIAAVPFHDVELMSVGVNYPHLPLPMRSLILPVESKREIFADKIVAMGARPYLKYRDVWDIKMLKDLRIPIDGALVRRKLADYGLEESAFLQRLHERREFLGGQEALVGLDKEMSRFLDLAKANLLRVPLFAQSLLGTVGAALLEAETQLNAMRELSSPHADPNAEKMQE